MASLRLAAARTVTSAAEALGADPEVKHARIIEQSKQENERMSSP